MDVPGWDETVLALTSRLAAIVDQELSNIITESKVIALVHVIHATVKHLAQQDRHFKEREGLLNQREQAVRVAEETLVQRKARDVNIEDSIAKVEASIQDVREDFAQKISIVHGEVMLSTAARDRVHQLENDIEHLHTKCESFKSKYEAEAAKSRDLRSHVRHLETDKDVLQNALDERQQFLSEREEKVKQLISQRDNLINTSQNLEVAKATLTASLGILGHRNTVLEGELAECKTTVTTLQHEIQRAKNQITGLNEAIGERVTMVTENQALRSKLENLQLADDRFCQVSRSWGAVFLDISTVLFLLSAGSKSQDELRKAVMTIVRIYVVETKTPLKLTEYINESKKSSIGHRCLHNIATVWSTERPLQDSECSCWNVGAEYCVVVSVKRQREDEVRGQFQLLCLY